MLGDSLRRRRGGRRSPGRPEDREPTGPPPRGQGLSRFSWWHWLLAAVVILVGSFGVGYLLSTQVLFPRPETAGTGIPVPSLYGDMRQEAEEAIRGAGLDVGEVSGIASVDTEVNRVLAQDPLPGQQLRRGGVVSFAVSTGSPELHVPPLQGMDVESARELLESIGFEVAIRRLQAEGVPGDRVVGSEPAAGVARRLPSVVTLLVSDSPTDAAPAPDDASPGPAPADSPAGPSGPAADDGLSGGLQQ